MDTIGFDFGCCNLKTSEGILIPAQITTANDYLITTGYEIEFNNQLFIIGEGDYDTNLNKTKRVNLLPMMCLALGLSTKEQFVRIVAGLPISQYKTKKDELLKIIEDNKVLEFKLNGEKREIYISDAAVFPEGVATYYSLDYEKRKFLSSKDLIVLDIGGRTTDIALLDKTFLFS